MRIELTTFRLLPDCDYETDALPTALPRNIKFKLSVHQVLVRQTHSRYWQKDAMVFVKLMLRELACILIQLDMSDRKDISC